MIQKSKVEKHTRYKKINQSINDKFFAHEQCSKYLDILDVEYDKDFSCFFRSFKAISEDDFSKAIEVLKEPNVSYINKYLKRFLENFDDSFIDFKPSIDVWSKTNVAKKEYDFICEVIFRNIIDNNIYPETLIDIGTGDGYLLNKLLSYITPLNQNIKLILVDKNVDLLNETKIKIRNNYPSIKSIRLIHDKIENINDLSLNLNQKTTVVNAASVLHELHLMNKSKVLNNFKKISNNIFISELESNLDLPDEQYTELAHSAYEFYNSLIVNTLLSPNISKSERNEFINNYLIFEVFHILTNRYENRINYHTTQLGWENIFTSIKWDFESYVTKFEKYLPLFFTFHLKNN